MKKKNIFDANNPKLNLFVGVIVGFLIACIMPISLYYSIAPFGLEDAVSYVKIVFYPFVAGTFILALIQFKYLKEWNKKQLTLTEINDINSKHERCLTFLDRYINYKERKEAISTKEMHDFMGQFISESEFKKLPKADHYKVVRENGKVFLFTDQGKKIKDKVSCILNNLEYVAAAVNDETFDDKLAKKILKSRLVYAVTVFEKYIEHLQHYHGWGTNVYNEMLIVKRRWEEENDDN